jgi:hypothetical protein
MKLSPQAVEQTLNCFDSQALPDNHPSVPQLSRAFGEHTFFVDDSGLHVVEPMESKEPSKREGMVVKIASWTDSSRTALAPQEPEPTNVIVALNAA